MIILSILFFVTALIYSSVGFGGGSTYLALLLIWGVPYTIFPVIALVCNIIVVSGNDACVALAEAIAGSEENFSDLMNEKANEILKLNIMGNKIEFKRSTICVEGTLFECMFGGN